VTSIFAGTLTVIWHRVFGESGNPVLSRYQLVHVGARVLCRHQRLEV